MTLCSLLPPVLHLGTRGDDLRETLVNSLVSFHTGECGKLLWKRGNHPHPAVKGRDRCQNVVV